MKYLSIILWVTQFGFSAVFPLCFFLLLGTWLEGYFGPWSVWACAGLGFMTAVGSVRSCFRALREETEITGKEL